MRRRNGWPFPIVLVAFLVAMTVGIGLAIKQAYDRGVLNEPTPAERITVTYHAGGWQVVRDNASGREWLTMGGYQSPLVEIAGEPRD